MEDTKKPAKPNIFYYLMAVFAFLIWGTSFAFGKLISPHPLNPITISCYRTIIGIITLFLIVFVSKNTSSWLSDFKKNFPKYLAVGVIFYAVSFLLEYWSLSLTRSSNQAILSNTLVIWVVIINLIFFKSRPTKIFLLGLVAAIIGVLLILITDELNFSSETIVGDLGSLIAYVFWGAYSALMAKINTKTEPLFSTLSIFITSLFLVLPITIFSGGITEISNLLLLDWGVLLYLGILCSGIAFWLYNRALSNKNISSEYIAIYSLLNPIIGVLMGILLHGDPLPIRKIIGICLILGSIIVVNRSTSVKVQLSLP
jgi:drug/metabolite transporter (DMT)-like permease